MLHMFDYPGRNRAVFEYYWHMTTPRNHYLFYTEIFIYLCPTNETMKITVRTTEKDKKFITNLVERGEYKTNSEVVRAALREFRKSNKK